MSLVSRSSTRGTPSVRLHKPLRFDEHHVPLDPYRISVEWAEGVGLYLDADEALALADLLSTAVLTARQAASDAAKATA